MRIAREIDLSAAPEAVYDVVMDPTRLEEWVTIHRGLRRAPAGPLRAGSEMVQSLLLAGVPVEIHWTVARAKRPSAVVWEGHGPALSRARILYGFAAAEGGCRFSYANEFELPGGPLGRLAAAALSSTHLPDREVDRSLERLRALVETRTEASG